jgi:hypothetical protein
MRPLALMRPLAPIRRASFLLACTAITSCRPGVSTGAAPLPGPHVAADTTAEAPHPPAPDTTVQGWHAGNLAVGAGVMIIRARYGGRVYVGAGDATHTIALTFNANDVDQFVLDARALLPPNPTTNAPTPVLTEPGSSRALSFARVRHRGQPTTYHFYFADESLHGFPLPATLVESKAVLTALARGARIAHEATPKAD